MKLQSLIIAALLALPVSLLLAQDSEPAPEPEVSRDATLEDLKFLAGGTWVGEGTIPALGTYRSEFSYEWILDENFIQTRHTMQLGEKVLADEMGMIGWDPDTETLITWSFGADGSHTRLNQVLTGNPDEVRFEGKTVGGGSPGEWATTITRKSDDEIRMVLQIKRNEKFLPYFATTFTRQAVPEQSTPEGK